nr:sigma-54 dependent transcriptional regulator [uncultured Prevotella sp.]
MVTDKEKYRILIVEDDLTYATMLKTWLGKKGFLVTTAGQVSKACMLIEKSPFDLILSDLRLPDRDGIALIPWLQNKGYDVPIMIMTRYADIRGAVQAMKEGAVDYVAKPIVPDELLNKINDALHHTEPEDHKEQAKIAPTENNEEKNDFLEGESEPARKLYDYVALVAPTPMSVLINGASGTGKEYVAHRIHQLSKRADKPFVPIDCGAIPDELAASEFFGHIKGSFTGAVADKTGAFEAANGGTLFLDEVGNLSYSVQVQLLRAIQERCIRKIGTNEEIQVDVRLVCATNENLQEAIAEGRFREDLYHRINEFTLRMPSLHERGEDVLLFANFFLDKANKELDRSIKGFSPEANKALLAYPWPGNLRQLKNVVKRAVLLTQGKLIQPDVLDMGETPDAKDLSLHNVDTEKSRIEEALRMTGNHKGKAAALLGIDRKTLYNKMKALGL